MSDNTVDKPTSFYTHDIFSDLPPEKQAIFDGFYTDLEEFRRKKFIFGKSHSIKKKVFLNFHFGKKLCVYALLYDVRAFQKSLLRYAGGDIVPLYICIERVAFEM